MNMSDNIPPATEKYAKLPVDYDTGESGEEIYQPNSSELKEDVTVQELTGVVYDEEPLSSSDDEFSSGYDNNIEADVAEFMVEEHLTQKTRNRLLALLRKHGHNDLPKDCRTLTRTPHIVNVVNNVVASMCILV